MKNLHILQQESIDEGRLQVRVRQKNMGTPVADARVSVSYSGDPQGKIEETDTNAFFQHVNLGWSETETQEA